MGRDNTADHHYVAIMLLFSLRGLLLRPPPSLTVLGECGVRRAQITGVRGLEQGERGAT